MKLPRLASGVHRVAVGADSATAGIRPALRVLGWNITLSCTNDPDLNNHCTLRVYGHGCWGYVDVWEDGTVESGGNFDTC
jgi:hypothetical protein